MGTFIVSGEILCTGSPTEEIIKVIQASLDSYYHGKVGFDCRVSNNQIELAFIRDLRYDIEGEFLCDFDMSMISGLSIDTFMPPPMGKPLVAPLIPYGKHFYCPDTEFIHLYKMMVEKMTGQKIKKVGVNADDCRIIMKIVF